MKVILLKAVPKVGKKDEVVEIASGYAQHALFPKKLAIPATPQALEALARRKQNVVAEKQVRHHLLDKAIADINGARVVMKVKANEQGNLFSKIHETDIATYLSDTMRINIDPVLLIFSNGPIKKLGIQQIGVVDGDFKANFTIELIQE